MSVDERIRQQLFGYADGLDSDPHRALDSVRDKTARRRRRRAAAVAASLAAAALVVAGLSAMSGNLLAGDSHPVIEPPPAPSPSAPVLSPRLIGVWEASATDLEHNIAPGDRQRLTATQTASLVAELPHRGRLILTISGSGSWRLVATNFYGPSNVLEHGWYDVEAIPGQVTLHDSHTGGTTVVNLATLKGTQPTRLVVGVVSATTDAQGVPWVLVQQARFGADFRLSKHMTS